ncbi:hypothetical protein EGH90_00055 [Kaistella haifensis]|nr:hypothetical protein EGH90_00055 [Kaistella haifensis]
MSRSNYRNLLDTSLNKLIHSLGTNVGTILSVLGLIGMGFTVGTYYNDYKKNIEILDIKKDFYKEYSDLKKEKDILEIEIEKQKNELENCEKTIINKSINNGKEQ